MALLGGLRGGNGVVDEGHAGAENFEAMFGDRDNRRFEADLAGTAVEKKRRFVAKGVADVLGRGGGEVGEAIGAGSGDWQLSCAKKREGDGVTGDAEAHGGQAGGDLVGDDGFLGQDESEWPRPVFACQAVGFVGPIGGEFARLFDGSQVNDERARGGALLQRVDFADRPGIERICA